MGGGERNEREVISRYRLPADSSTFNFVDTSNALQNLGT